MRRRNATTEFLKECIADAMLRLMKTKSLESITIQEITDLADVGRVTYYRNFSSKEEVLEFKLELLCKEYAEEIEASSLKDSYHISILFFQFIYSIRDMVSILYDGKQEHILLKTFYKLLGPRMGETQHGNYQRAFFACGLFGFVNQWIKNQFAETPEQLGELLVCWVGDFE